MDVPHTDNGSDTPLPRQRRILVCVTTSPHASAVVRAGLQIAAAMHAVVTPVHVGADTPEVRDQLVDFLTRMGAREWAGQLVVRPGKPDVVICAAAQAQRAHLIVAGALEQETVVREILGSTARRIARRAPCSVFLLVGPEVQWRRVVTALDRTRTSVDLLAFLPEIHPGNAGTELHLMYEQPRPLSYDQSMDTLSWEQVLAELSRVGRPTDMSRLEGFFDCVSARRFRVALGGAIGPGGTGLADYARDQDADVVVIPAPNRALGLWYRFFGHPAIAILQRLPCSLLLFRSSRPIRKSGANHG